MEHRRLPPQLANKLTTYAEYQFKRLKGFDENELLDTLPASLSARINGCIIQGKLRQLRTTTVPGLQVIPGAGPHSQPFLVLPASLAP